MTTGITSPACCCVRALNCLQNSMMLMPCWPSAGPTGGAGVALPALHCSFTIAWMGLAIDPAPLNRLDLKEVQLDRRGPAEDAEHDLHLATLVVDFVHNTREGTERPVDHAHVVADPERLARHRLGLGGFHMAEDAPNLVLLERDRVLSRADEACDARNVLHHVSRLVVQVHLDHHVGREGLALRDLPLAVLHFGEILGRNQDLAEMIVEGGGMNRLLEIRLHLVLVARVGVDHVPLLGHAVRTPYRNNRPSVDWSSRSTANRNTATSSTVTITTKVESRSSMRVGQLTLVDSTRTSAMKSFNRWTTPTFCVSV